MIAEGKSAARISKFHLKTFVENIAGHLAFFLDDQIARTLLDIPVIPPAGSDGCVPQRLVSILLDTSLHLCYLLSSSNAPVQ